MFSKADWCKIIILLLVSSLLWGWVWYEYQKPLYADGFTDVNITHIEK